MFPFTVLKEKKRYKQDEEDQYKGLPREGEIHRVILLDSGRNE